MRKNTARRKGLFTMITVILYILLILIAGILILWVRNNVIEFKTFAQAADKETTKLALFHKALAADCITAKDSRGQPIKFVYDRTLLDSYGGKSLPADCFDLGPLNKWHIIISVVAFDIGDAVKIGPGPAGYGVWEWGDKSVQINFNTAVNVVDLTSTTEDDKGVRIAKFEFGTDAADIKG